MMEDENVNAPLRFRRKTHKLNIKIYISESLNSERIRR